MEEISSASPQLKRKLESDDELPPLGKSARFDSNQENTDMTAAATEEVQQLIGRRHDADETKAIIEREYDEVTMGPTGSGEHSEFMKELQSRAEIVNSGAVQNEGNKERLLGQLGSDKLKRDGVDDEEAAALAIIRGTLTGDEDMSVLSGGAVGNGKSDAMYEATGIPKGMKFEINVRDDRESSQPDGEGELDFDVVISENPKLNLDAFKAKSSLAHKGAMAHRRLPTRGQATATVRLTQPVEVKEEKNADDTTTAPYKPGMSTAEKVRATLASKDTSTKTTTTASNQDIIEAQRRALKQSYRPDAGFAVESSQDEELQQRQRLSSSSSSSSSKRRESTPSSSSGGDDEDKSYRPTLAKLAALERRPRSKSSVEFDLAKVKLKRRDTYGSGGVEEAMETGGGEKSSQGKARKTGDPPPGSELANVVQRIRSVSSSHLKAAAELATKETTVDESSSPSSSSSSFFSRSRLRSSSGETDETKEDAKANDGEKSPRAVRRPFERKTSGISTANILKPSALPPPSAQVDAVPGWKKALLERRKVSGGPGAARRVSTPPQSADEVPAWKRDLMKRKKEGEAKRSVSSDVVEEANDGRKEPGWIGEAGRMMKESASLSKLVNRIARVSVSEEEDKTVPSFLKEFQARQKKSSRAERHPGAIEPEWMRRLNRQKSPQAEEV
ncbi:micronuclear linker histone polyprotein-like [Oscarella lobularis]|uniref:micronuclear linker histone polyprotein-like n=1 Tax=Oscarella lobularis TaxID=121494 RepID=UPI00331358F6